MRPVMTCICSHIKQLSDISPQEFTYSLKVLSLVLKKRGGGVLNVINVPANSVSD